MLYTAELKKRQIVRKFLVKIGLTPGQGQARILRYLAANSHLTQRELADACMLDVTTMSRVLDKLEKLGLILRERNPGCRRAYQISLTAEGQKKAQKIEEAFQRLADQMYEGIPEKDLDVFSRTLIKIEENLEEEEPVI